MTEAIDGEIEGTEVAIEFQPGDDEAVEKLKRAFAENDILESHAFSGAEILTVLTKITKGTIEKLLKLVSQNKFKSCKIKISTKEIVIMGYGPQDASQLLDSEGVKKRIRDYRK